MKVVLKNFQVKVICVFSMPKSCEAIQSPPFSQSVHNSNIEMKHFAFTKGRKISDTIFFFDYSLVMVTILLLVPFYSSIKSLYKRSLLSPTIFKMFIHICKISNS